MKADHRKQLEHNELANRLTGWWKGTEGAKSNSTLWAVLGVALLVSVLVIAWRYYSDSAQRTRAAGWKQIEEASNASDLESIVEANRGTVVGRAAKAQLARLSLVEGLNKLGSEFQRSKAIADVEKARSLYGELANEAKGDALLQRESMLGSAKAEEALVGIPKTDPASESRGSLDKALELYQQTADQFATTPQGKEAASRAKDIRENKQRIQQFYEDLNKRYVKLDVPPPPVFPPIEPKPKEAVIPPPLKPTDPTKPADPMKPLTPPPGDSNVKEKPAVKDPVKPLPPPATDPMKPAPPKPPETKPADPKLPPPPSKEPAKPDASKPDAPKPQPK